MLFSEWERYDFYCKCVVVVKNIYSLRCIKMSVLRILVGPI